jgi:hypothetical protein
MSTTGREFRRALVACAWLGAACFFVIAGYSVSQLIIVHGSNEGNILRLGFALLSFLIGISLVVATVLTRKP